MAKNTAVIGLDIEPSYIAAADVRVNGSIGVVHAASAPLCSRAWCATAR